MELKLSYIFVQVEYNRYIYYFFLHTTGDFRFLSYFVNPKLNIIIHLKYLFSLYANSHLG